MFTIPNHTLQSGFSMPTLGFGTYRMGKGFEYGSTDQDDAEMKAIRNAFENGMIHIDTAELYSSGYVEELVANAMAGVSREKYFLTSKVKGQNATYDGIHKAVRESLGRLKTDYLDLYLIHYRDLSLPLEPAVRAMDELVDEGLVRNIGVSNFKTETCKAAQDLSKHKFVCNQVQYSLVHREPEADNLVEYCQNNDMILVAWGPVLKIDSSQESSPLVLQMLNKYSCTLRQLALAWLANQKNVCTLFKTSDQHHLEENLQSTKIIISPEDIELLRAGFPERVFEHSGFGLR